MKKPKLYFETSEISDILSHFLGYHAYVVEMVIIFTYRNIQEKDNVIEKLTKDLEEMKRENERLIEKQGIADCKDYCSIRIMLLL